VLGTEERGSTQDGPRRKDTVVESADKLIDRDHDRTSVVTSAQGGDEQIIA
jgi:hypothetical protein